MVYVLELEMAFVGTTMSQELIIIIIIIGEGSKTKITLHG
jgi:hypothetical protein